MFVQNTLINSLYSSKRMKGITRGEFSLWSASCEQMVSLKRLSAGVGGSRLKENCCLFEMSL